MYTEHYGLSGQPFQLTPDARFWFDSRTHRKAMAYLGYGLAQGEGFITVTGEIGAGKSMLVAHLLANLTACAHRDQPISTQSRHDMLRLVARAGLDTERQDKRPARTGRQRSASSRGHAHLVGRRRGAEPPVSALEDQDALQLQNGGRR